MGIREEVQTECVSLSISTVPGWNPVRPHRIIKYKIAQKESGGDFDPYRLSEANHMRPRLAKFESSLHHLSGLAATPTTAAAAASQFPDWAAVRGLSISECLHYDKAHPSSL
jgi:hypothetical protein